MLQLLLEYRSNCILDYLMVSLIIERKVEKVPPTIKGLPPLEINATITHHPTAKNITHLPPINNSGGGGTFL